MIPLLLIPLMLLSLMAVLIGWSLAIEAKAKAEIEAKEKKVKEEQRRDAWLDAQCRARDRKVARLLAELHQEEIDRIRQIRAAATGAEITDIVKLPSKH